MTTSGTVQERDEALAAVEAASALYEDYLRVSQVSDLAQLSASLQPVEVPAFRAAPIGLVIAG